MKRVALLGMLSLIWIAPQSEAATFRAPAAQSSTISANGLTFSYRAYGSVSARPILLINGVGMQQTDWPPELIQALVARKFRVIAFDNRDTGETTHFSARGAPDWPAVFKAMAAGSPPPLPYSVADMADDGIALMDALHIARGDLVGASGGAAIAELMAIRHPDRVRSLTLLFANSGNPARRFPADPARTAHIPQPVAGESLAGSIERRVETARALAGRGYPFDEARIRKMAAISAARDRDPFGVARQGAAQLVLGDIRRLAAPIGSIRAPTLVIHGSDDPLISVDAGRDVADAIPGATFMVIPGMGHELPVQVLPSILNAVDVTVIPAP